jgi:hypothetical protein
MDEESQVTAALPDAGATPPGAQTQERRGIRRPLLIAAGAVVVIGAAVGISVAATGGSSSITVHGTVQLNALQYGDSANPLNPKDGDACSGFGADSDIAPGLTITIEGASGQPLATGLLQAGTMRDVATTDGDAMGLCVLPFTITVPGGQPQYAVAIAGHGAQEYSQAQLEKGVALSLGAG